MSKEKKTDSLTGQPPINKKLSITEKRLLNLINKKRCPKCNVVLQKNLKVRIHTYCYSIVEAVPIINLFEEVDWREENTIFEQTEREKMISYCKKCNYKLKLTKKEVMSILKGGKYDERV